MDRNKIPRTDPPAGKVALRKESVDRNRYSKRNFSFVDWSLSARRAWIEICSGSVSPGCATVALRKESVDRNKSWPNISETRRVALRKESVDRNCSTSTTRRWAAVSLSARRAWIEMFAAAALLPAPVVALRKESVDRNQGGLKGSAQKAGRRSPQGERG